MHASSVAFADRAVLITGPSGSGKSSLALELMSIGASLVADDRVDVERKGAALSVSCPPSLPHLIEARGVGLLPATPRAGPTPLALVVDLSRQEEARLPPARQTELLGVGVPMLLGVEARFFPAAIKLYLEGHSG